MRADGAISVALVSDVVVAEMDTLFTGATAVTVVTVVTGAMVTDG